MRVLRSGLFWAALIGLTFSAPCVLASNYVSEGVVARVIDGDTFDLVDGTRVRLTGIDTPEYEPWKGRRDPYGKEAADFSRGWLVGKKVRLEADVEAEDRYGRQLAYAYLESGEFVNLRLVREGFARARYYQPNGRYYALLKEAEKKAKEERRGLWRRQKK